VPRPAARARRGAALGGPAARPLGVGGGGRRGRRAAAACSGGARRGGARGVAPAGAPWSGRGAVPDALPIGPGPLGGARAIGARRRPRGRGSGGGFWGGNGRNGARKSNGAGSVRNRVEWRRVFTGSHARPLAFREVLGPHRAPAGVNWTHYGHILRPLPHTRTFRGRSHLGARAWRAWRAPGRREARRCKPDGPGAPPRGAVGGRPAAGAAGAPRAARRTRCWRAAGGGAACEALSHSLARPRGLLNALSPPRPRAPRTPVRSRRAAAPAPARTAARAAPAPAAARAARGSGLVARAG
jgi:hypothetical protein